MKNKMRQKTRWLTPQDPKQSERYHKFRFQYVNKHFNVIIVVAGALFILAALQNFVNPSMVSRLRLMSVALQFLIGSILILLKSKIKSLIVYANPLLNIT